jgi:hypothetical protein
MVGEDDIVDDNVFGIVMDVDDDIGSDVRIRRMMI